MSRLDALKRNSSKTEAEPKPDQKDQVATEQENQSVESDVRSEDKPDKPKRKPRKKTTTAKNNKDGWKEGKTQVGGWIEDELATRMKDVLAHPRSQYKYAFDMFREGLERVIKEEEDFLKAFDKKNK